MPGMYAEYLKIVWVALRVVGLAMIVIGFSISEKIMIFAGASLFIASGLWEYIYRSLILKENQRK